MPCFRPLKGYYARVPNPESGKFPVVFNARLGDCSRPIDLPCGQCIGCRLERSRQIAIRAMHEASLYDLNCFLTLTYDDEHLPAHGFLDYSHPPAFMKRLRKRFGAGIRAYGCAEYGSLYSRPHYHLLIFNFDFPDKYESRSTPSGFKVWRSPSLDGCFPFTTRRDDSESPLWGFGLSEIGSLTFESAAYVARYCTKKVTGRRAQSHYEVLDPVTGEFFQRPPESAVCVPRKKGLGRPWLERFGRDVYAADSVISRGMEMRPPKYYDRLYTLWADQEFDADVSLDMDQLRVKRRALAAQMAMRDPSYFSAKYKYIDRVAAKERCAEARFNLLYRGFENGS